MPGERESLFLPQEKEKCILSESPELENLQETIQEDMVEVTPCTSERGKVMAEIDLSRDPNQAFLDSEILCLLLESYRSRFAEMKCSSELGLGRMMWKARRIYAYENGKFKIRFAHSREDSIQVLNSTKRLLLSSILCENCGHPALECALDKCETCLTDKKPEVIQLEGRFNAPILLRGLESYETALEKIQKIGQGSLLKENSTLQSKIKRKLQEAIEYAMNFSLEAPSPQDLHMGVELIALSRESLLLLDYEEELAEKGQEEPELAKNLHESLWKSEENLTRGLSEEAQEKTELGEKKASETLEILDNIEEEIKDENLTRALKKIRNHVHTSKNFMEKIRE